jgi:hypothetical protein
MAYGNYGGFVTLDGERMENYEDQYPYEESTNKSGYHNAFRQIEDRKFSLMHVVLGSGAVRLCAYKIYPRMLVNGNEVDLNDFSEHETHDDYFYAKGEIEGHKFKIEVNEDNGVMLDLYEPDGSHWKGKADYCYGAGHTEFRGYID